MCYVYFLKLFHWGIDGATAKITYNSLDLTFDFSKREPSVLGNIIEIFSQEIYKPFLYDFDLR